MGRVHGLLERTRRTKTAWLILLASFKERSRHTSNRLRRPKKLLHSTWPSSGRLNRTLKRLRKELSSPWSCKLKSRRNGQDTHQISDKTKRFQNYIDKIKKNQEYKINSIHRKK